MNVRNKMTEIMENKNTTILMTNQIINMKKI